MNRRNNLDALRLLAATGVMALHIADLSAQRSLQWLHLLDARVALASFFVISGHLVFMSHARSTGLRDYADKRLRRILPGYIAVVLLCAFAGVCVTNLAWTQYFGWAWLRYLLANLSFLNFLQPSLPGVFGDNPYPGAPVNGALWTIKVELMFYAIVPMMARAIARWGHHLVLGLGFVAGVLWWSGCLLLAQRTGHQGYLELAKQMPGQLMLFLPGAWSWYERERLRRWGHRLGLVGLVMMAACLLAGISQPSWSALIYPLALSAVVFWAAHTLPYLGNVTRFGDLSYGTYILHFPLIQTLVHWQVFAWAPELAAALSLMLTLLLASQSWRWIEAPWLRRHRTLVPQPLAAQEIRERRSS